MRRAWQSDPPMWVLQRANTDLAPSSWGGFRLLVLPLRFVLVSGPAHPTGATRPPSSTASPVSAMRRAASASAPSPPACATRASAPRGTRGALTPRAAATTSLQALQCPRRARRSVAGRTGRPTAARGPACHSSTWTGRTRATARRGASARVTASGVFESRGGVCAGWRAMSGGGDPSHHWHAAAA